jgi:hypothetical protein
VNDNRIAPGIARLVDPDGDLTRRDVDEIRHAVAIHITQQQPLGVEADPREEDGVLKPGAVAHGDTAAPPAVASVRPILDPAIVDEQNVLKAVTGHIPELDAGRTWSAATVASAPQGAPRKRDSAVTERRRAVTIV